MRTVGKSGAIFDIMNYWLQIAVNECDDFIRSKIARKAGLIRSQILGKRVDYSSRAVIVNGPTLKPNEIGIPFRMAIELFAPFIIHIILYKSQDIKSEIEQEIRDYIGMELSVDSIRKIITSIRKDDKVPERLYEIFYNATEEAMKGRYVLAKRDPVLHPESVRAFTPILTRQNAMSICNLQTSGYNADFDGDQMAVFHPLSTEAQEDCKRMMSAMSGTSSSSITYEIAKEANVGLYLLTKDYPVVKPPIKVTKDDLDKAVDPSIPVIYRGRATSMGKAIFNDCLPDGFRFIDTLVNKKVVNKLLVELYSHYPQNIASDSAFRIEHVGYKFATIIAPSITLDDMIVPKEILRLKEKLDKATTEEAVKLIEEMRELMIKHLKDTGLYYLAESGATKGWDQPTQILVAKGIISDVQGNILKPIKGSFSGGLTPTEHFQASLGARKGIADRVLNTATTGYISRKLAFLLNSVEVDWLLKDCKTTRTLDLRLTKDIASRLQGRYIVDHGKVKEFDPTKFKEGDLIHLRSPIYCKSWKLCHTCYGKLLERHKSPYVGILAAQIIGERGTQLIMRTFHTGGAIKIKKRNVIEEILNNDPYLSKEHLAKVILQTDKDLIALKEGKLIINLEDYDVGDSIKISEEENTVWVKSLLSVFDYGEGKINIILDFPCYINIGKSFSKTRENIIISYDANERIMEVPIEKEDIKQLVLYVDRLAGGREIYKDTQHLLLKLFKIYGGSISDMDLVHMEVLISQCLRDRERPILPARIGKNPDDPIMFNIRKNIFTTSFLQGMAFENIDEAIRTGLTSKYELPASILEKVMSGELVEPPETFGGKK